MVSWTDKARCMNLLGVRTGRYWESSQTTPGHGWKSRSSDEQREQLLSVGEKRSQRDASGRHDFAREH